MTDADLQKAVGTEQIVAIDVGGRIIEYAGMLRRGDDRMYYVEDSSEPHRRFPAEAVRSIRPCDDLRGRIRMGRVTRPDGLVPFVPVLLTQPSSRPDGLTDAGKPPLHQAAWALVDTGANVTVVHPAIVNALDLPVKGELQSKNPHGAVTGRRVRVGFVVVTPDIEKDVVTYVDALEHEFDSADVAKILLGANTLTMFRLSYDGPARTFTLSW